MFDVILNETNFLRLMAGLWITVKISLISIIISLIGGLILGVLMSSKNKFIYIILKICLEIVRIMPQLVWLFIVYFGLSSIFSFSAITASIVVFSIWGVFEMMDLVRGAVLSIPKHTFESAASLGLKKFQIYIYVIIPLALRRLIPGAINLLSRMIKSTSIVVLIGVVEVLKVSQQIIELNLLTNNYAPLIVYGFVFFLYFAICYPVSKLSKILENRWN
ncbi:amino acid ABC transporter permease [Campylobacter ureolyticus]|jgi:amino ABC transporter, permease protein, 3-TM region, his/glu/gln/arg/opine family|uniref:Amino acid ABC transporter permease n=1 Tax=Campylobacter ureolyticus TaxID=827 RepID=A0A9Q4KIF8_9BACT|nr:amino acid ABC transporter permease [Campylobacter ureolyticus]MCZ6103140.1 amino acid ABC transporter permease [Campylobacter ureolyticus]MCZ6117633.1 amino acid ABC transporter permease [Campylobacter ureolyticus]MCZ6150304.1 amino acid ABC transporter permease [Campylobacter ureolyticus]MCZ6160203.1 amino acid ABC transporter permease [Campylobacter ureolyticus]MCZ6163880.1 amino acid ABC transporter permease [Campylobacter ureolyticus]